MPGVFSMASHAVLQYLPVVASQEQIGCAHFLAGFGVLPSSCLAQCVFDAGSIMDDSQQQCCPLTYTFEFSSQTGRAADLGRPLSFNSIMVSEKKGVS
jgi:hypothetical protein